MDILIRVVLPLALAFIMFTLGLGLTVADFRRVLERPVAFGIGASCQLILVPLIAFLIAMVLGMTGALAVGLMILALCPGGVTSNLMSKLAKGDVALSVSLTGVVSILSIFTVPVGVAWSVSHFMGEAGPDVSITGLAIAMFFITTLPVALGVGLRHFASDFADRWEPGLAKTAVVLFIIVVIAALTAGWNDFLEQMPVIGAALIALNFSLIVISAILATLAGRSPREVRTIAIEAGVQNGTVGIALGTIVAAGAAGFTPYSMPSAVYGVTMYMVTLPFVFWFRSRNAGETA
ncbi:MAG: bile acid:sodium symporter family protein [Pseudomonadota bacterium]